MLRRTFVIRAASLLAFPLIAFGANAQQPVTGSTTTIIIARHGEKALEPRDDPMLSPAGEARALALADAVRDAGVTAIYSTPWKRTQGTARPTSERLKIPITTFDAPPGDRDYGKTWATELVAKNRGQVVLVLGHSNTVPNILRGLGISDAPAIADAEYDNLFIVMVPETGPPRVVRSKYGAR
jgi:broad specificity phosphatase PhoE